MKKDSDFLKRKDEVADFNSKHKWLKRGISMTHCRCVCSSSGCGSCKKQRHWQLREWCKSWLQRAVSIDMTGCSIAVSAAGG